MNIKELSLGEKQTILKLRKENPQKHQSVTSKTISTGQGCLNQPFEEDLESNHIEAIPQDANHSSVARTGRQDYNLQSSTKMSHKSSKINPQTYWEQDNDSKHTAITT